MLAWYRIKTVLVQDAGIVAKHNGQRETRLWWKIVNYGVRYLFFLIGRSSLCDIMLLLENNRRVGVCGNTRHMAV